MSLKSDADNQFTVTSRDFFCLQVVFVRPFELLPNRRSSHASRSPGLVQFGVDPHVLGRHRLRGVLLDLAHRPGSALLHRNLRELRVCGYRYFSYPATRIRKILGYDVPIPNCPAPVFPTCQNFYISLQKYTGLRHTNRNALFDN